MKRLKWTIASYLALTLSAAAATCDLPKPGSAADLIVVGQIGRCTTEGEAQFDSTLFSQLPRHKVRTSNPWEQGEVEYEGVLFSDLLDHLKAAGSKVVIFALNDYSIDVPIADLRKNGVLLADKRNGVAMPVSEKGPYFVVFPFDQNAELKSEERYAQSVWQVNRLSVQP